MLLVPRTLQLAPLAAKQIIGDVVVDPSSATFPGTPPSCPPRVCINGHDGLGGTGACRSDDDCTDEPPCAAGATCEDSCPDLCTLVDADGDGVPDNIEQRGWTVRIKLASGEFIERQVTGDPFVAATDGDGLTDGEEFRLRSDPRSRDTDADGLSDAEEFNLIFSDQNSQDTDGDGIDDRFEVEFFKTNALLADSDGDGYTDSQELFDLNRDPRVADLPEQKITVGDVNLQINESFMFMDQNGEMVTETSKTETNRQTSRDSERTRGRTTLRKVSGEAGIDACQSDCKEAAALTVGRIVAKVEGGAEFTQITNDQSKSASQEAFQLSLEKGRQLSSSSAVSRSVVGARMDAEVALENSGDVAFALSNVELIVSTTDPANPGRFLPVATLLPNTTLLTGQPAVFNLGPLQPTRKVLFSNREVFPNLVEDLMRQPRGLVFEMSNFDLTTADGRNFAIGSQVTRDRTAGILIDFGDGRVRHSRVITAAVLDRAREDLRCAGGRNKDRTCTTSSDCGAVACEAGRCREGQRRGLGCSVDADCGPVACEGGRIVGGFEGFTGTGRTRGLPVDFILEDVLQMRKHRPARILAGANGRSDTTAQGDDVQIVEPTVAASSESAIVVAPGPNGVLDSTPGGDDIIEAPPPDGIRPGPDRSVQSVAEGDDVQLILAGIDGLPEDAVAITAGDNGVLETRPRGDDRADVVTGYEVSPTCDADTEWKIVAGPNKLADTPADPGRCLVAFGLRAGGTPNRLNRPCRTHADCGENPETGRRGICRGDTACPSSSLRQCAGGPDGGETCMTDADCEASICDTVCPPGMLASSGTTVVGPGGNGVVDSVPRGDDVLFAPGLPCTADSECPGGTCTGAQNVVRIENRRRGQFRRFWTMLLPDESQIQTDFGQIRLRAGETLALAFIQDLDRDGLQGEIEDLHGSSDAKQDTDGDGLDDFVEIRIGWDVGVVGQPIRHVFSDPADSDSDNDGLDDFEESDVHLAIFDPFPELGLPRVTQPMQQAGMRRAWSAEKEGAKGRS